MGGCGKSQPRSANLEPKPKVAVTPPQRTAVAGGSGTRYANTKQVNRERLWTVNWDAADIAFAEGGAFSGQMREVTGEIFQKDKATATFSADLGEAIKGTNRLKLVGNVRVVSKNVRAPDTVLTANRILWFPETQRYLASGNVLVEGSWGTVGPMENLVTSANLDTFGTLNGYPDVPHDVKPGKGINVSAKAVPKK